MSTTLAPSTTSHHHGCPFCVRTFNRVDSARRHSRTCSSRGDRPLPPNAKRGRKLHACNECSQVKLSCDAKSPCARCTSRRLTCTYGRFCKDLKECTGPPSKRSIHPALSFLLGCANPLGGHVDTVILDGEPELEHDEVVPPKLNLQLLRPISRTLSILAFFF